MNQILLVGITSDNRIKEFHIIFTKISKVFGIVEAMCIFIVKNT